MPVGLARRSSYRIDPTKCREGGFRVEAFWIAPRSDQESGCRVGTHTEGAHQGRGCRPGESVQLLFQVLDLRSELAVAAAQGAESILGCGSRVTQRARTETDAPAGQGTGGETIEGFAKLGGGRNHQSLHLVDSLSPGFDSRVLDVLEHPDHLDLAPTRFRCGIGYPRKYGASSHLRVSGVALPFTAAC
jgi:hypothetical protein